MDLWNRMTSDFGLPFTPLEIIYGLVACILSVLIGTVLAKKQARAFSTPKHKTTSTTAPHQEDLPTVTFVDYGDMRFLHLGTPSVQGSMKLSKPFDIHLEYVQRMMGWLLFTDLNNVQNLHAMQLGLGAASLTKFCHHHLNMQTTAIELNPQVITTCRQWFHLPPDDSKLQVTIGDAAEAVTQPQWFDKVDVLQIDLYDQEADRPVHDSEAFYANCRQLLTPQGCLVVNLFGRHMHFKQSMNKLAQSFGKDALWAFKPTPAGNTIVLAFCTPRTQDKQALRLQAQAIEERWPLPATKWLKALTPYAMASHDSCT